MTPPVLSILICSLGPRKDMLQMLLQSLYRQCGKLIKEDVTYGPVLIHNMQFSLVEIIVGSDNHSVTTGAKRNMLMELATGDYTVFIDDDDSVPHYYVSEILRAAQINCDCMAINGVITKNGADEKQWFVSMAYGHWHTKNNVYYRTPLHISPIRRTIAIQVRYPNISSGEDSIFSKNVFPLIKTECIIPLPLYYYRFRTNKT